jgi:hypothetical protein
LTGNCQQQDLEKTMKKRLIVWMLLAALTLSLCACAKAPAAESAEAQAAPRLAYLPRP